MKTYILPVFCTVCGGEGMARPRDAAAMYTGRIVHEDKQVCIDNLRRKLVAAEKKCEKTK